MFQKKARSQGSRYQFSYGGEVLEHSTSYSYLGIQISASGGFSLAVKATVHLSAEQSYFHLLRCSDGVGTSPGVRRSGVTASWTALGVKAGGGAAGR